MSCVRKGMDPRLGSVKRLMSGGCLAVRLVASLLFVHHTLL